MQADAIPDWAIYIILTPIFPIMGVIHLSLGILQTATVISVAAWRLTLFRHDPLRRPRLFVTTYIPLLLIPNVAVVVWGILTDPAIHF